MCAAFAGCQGQSGVHKSNITCVAQRKILMRLSAPNLLVFMISFILALAVVAIQFFGADIPIISSVPTITLLLVAYGILAVSNLIRGL